MRFTLSLRIRSILAPFLYGAMFIFGIIILWLVSEFWQLTVQPCFNYSYTYDQRFEWKAEMERSPTVSHLPPGFVNEQLHYWDNHPEHIEYWGGCGHGKAAGNWWLLTLWRYGPYALSALLLFLANWTTNIFDRRDRIKAMDHFRQSLFYYLMAPSPWLIIKIYENKYPDSEPDGKVYILAIIGVIMIVSNILYLTGWALLKRYRRSKQAAAPR